MKEHAETTAGDAPRAEARDLLVLRAGGLAFAVYAEECEGVTPWAEPAPLPHAPAAVLGVAPVRGRMRTVLDPARLFEAAGLAPAPGPRAYNFLASLAGDEQLALACESHADARVADADLRPAPDSPALPLRATFHEGGETVRLLDPARLFDAAMAGTERRRRRSVNSE
ncbi:MAG TPA: chemotaxis protein CheW [Pyrinomonadaceae bacterium]|jgi:chemotaxis signal transduction protein